jgi:hypothetical protein
MAVENQINMNTQTLVKTDIDTESHFNTHTYDELTSESDELSFCSDADSVISYDVSYTTHTTTDNKDKDNQQFKAHLSHILLRQSICTRLSYAKHEKTTQLCLLQKTLNQLQKQRLIVKSEANVLTQKYNDLIEKQLKLIYKEEMLCNKNINLLQNELYVFDERDNYINYLIRFLPNTSINQLTDAQLFYNCIYHHYQNCSDNEFIAGKLSTFPTNPENWSDKQYNNNFDNLIWFCRELYDLI